MRHFSLMKLLTFSSFSTTPSECLLTHRNSRNDSKLSSRGLQLKKTLIDASMGECNETVHAGDVISSRRQALHSIMGLSTGFAFMTGNPNVVTALDMDAFMNSQLDADTKNCDPKVDSKCIPKLSSDEAMCKYGQSGDARGEACRRVKEAGGKLPTSSGSPVKSLGGAYAM